MLNKHLQCVSKGLHIDQGWETFVSPGVAEQQLPSGTGSMVND